MKRESVKPFVGGVVAGAALLAVAAFGTGWVVTAGSSTQRVEAAWIDGQASSCASLAQANRDATGDVADLSGYQARDARTALAVTHAVVLLGDEAADARVISACADLLKTSGA